MKRIITIIWEDIKKGEKLDVYLNILAAISLIIFSFFGKSSLSPIVIAILITISISNIVNGYRIDKLITYVNQSHKTFFITHFSDEIQKTLSEKMFEANDLLIIGVTLSNTQDLNYHIMKQKLQNGNNIRIVLVNPDSNEACEYTAKRRYAPTDKSVISTQIKNTLNSLIQLQANFKGKLELRVIDFPLAHGGILIDSNTPTGVFYFWHYGFKTYQPNRPKFIICPDDGYWYSFFQEEAKKIWEDATPYSP